MASRYEGNFSTIATLYFANPATTIVYPPEIAHHLRPKLSSAFSMVLGFPHLQFSSGAVVHPVYEGTQLSSMVEEVHYVILTLLTDYSMVRDVFLLG